MTETTLDNLLFDDSFTKKFICQRCARSYKTEHSFINHKCSKPSSKTIIPDIKVIYQALALYSKWSKLLKMKNKFDGNLDKFMQDQTISKRFIELAEYTSRHRYDGYTYLAYLVRNKISFKKWTTEDIEHHNAYLNHVGYYDDPIMQAVRTFEVIDRWATMHPSRSHKKFYEQLSPPIIASMLGRELLWPWPVLTYEPLASRIIQDDSYHYDILYEINVPMWLDKIRENRDLISRVIDIMDNGYHFDNGVEND